MSMGMISGAHPGAGTVVPAGAGPARTQLASPVGRPTVGGERGVGDSTARGWLALPGRRVVVPAQDQRAVTVDARAQAVAGEELRLGHQADTGCHGHGSTAGSARLEPVVGGIPGRPTETP
jgi:hypothetical protein